MKTTISLLLILLLNGCSTTINSTKNNGDKKGCFTLQEYVDKAAVYLNEKNSTQEINSVPVIVK